MASWVITRDHTEPENSPDTLAGDVFWTDNAHKDIHKNVKFRLYDDDKILYYEGFAYLSEDDEGFEPLDWATAYAGCTRIEYWNEAKHCYEWL